MITNSDLDLRVTELAALIATDPMPEEMRAFVVAVIRQSYEAAALMAESHHDHCGNDYVEEHGRYYCLQHAAGQIRKLGEEFDTK